MPQFQFNVPTLKSVARLCSEDETRYALNGVHVILKPGFDVLLEATDGRRLIRHQTDWSHDSAERTEFIIPVGAINDSPIRRNAFPNFLTYDGKQITMALCDLMLISPTIDAQYPSYEQVIPSPLPENFPPVQVALNGMFLSEIIDVLMDLTGERDGLGVTITSKGENEPLCFKTRNSLAVLMPMRIR